MYRLHALNVFLALVASCFGDIAFAEPHSSHARPRVSRPQGYEQKCLDRRGAIFHEISNGICDLGKLATVNIGSLDNAENAKNGIVPSLRPGAPFK